MGDLGIAILILSLFLVVEIAFGYCMTKLDADP
jgi:hypothetical protein